MKTTHPSFDPACGICATISDGDPARLIHEGELWTVRHAEPPYGVPGWMMLLSRRHVGGVAHFDDREAASFGPSLRHFEKVLEEVTGALRIYTAAMGESFPHFHAHMVPRYASMPRAAKAWGVFDLQRAAAAGEFSVDATEVSRVIAAYRKALTEQPPP